MVYIVLCGTFYKWCSRVLDLVTTWTTYVENQSVQTNVSIIWSEPSCGGEGIFSFFLREVKVPFQITEKVRKYISFFYI